jgi:hypothetical protein
LWVCVLKLSKKSWKVRDNGTMTKELALQKSNCSYVLKPNTNPIHFQKAYFAHFETKFSLNFSLKNNKTMCTKIFESLLSSFAFITSYVATKMEFKCLCIVCHNFEVCKLFNSRHINLVSKGQLR